MTDIASPDGKQFVELEAKDFDLYERKGLEGYIYYDRHNLRWIGGFIDTSVEFYAPKPEEIAFMMRQRAYSAPDCPEWIGENPQPVSPLQGQLAGFFGPR